MSISDKDKLNLWLLFIRLESKGDVLSDEQKGLIIQEALSKVEDK